MSDPLDKTIDDLTELFLAPLKAMGEVIGREIDKTNANVRELRQHVAGLQDRVADLERRA